MSKGDRDRKAVSPDRTDVVVLVGGQGSRLKQVVSDRPKPMAAIGERPFLDLLIDYAAGFGFKRFVLCTGYLSEYIETYYSRHPRPQEVLFSKEEKPLGTAGAVLNAGRLIVSDPFLVLNGDSLCRVDLGAFLSFHSARRSRISMAIAHVKNAGDYGTIAIDGACSITRYEEKVGQGREGYVNAGIYCCERAFLDAIPRKVPCSLERDVFPFRVGKGFYGFETSEELIDIGTPERYRNASTRLT